MQEHPLDLARRWYAQAADDFEAAQANAEQARYSLACFLSQQSAEKALKGVLIWLRGDHPRRHVIGHLISELAEVDRAAAAQLRESSSLDLYYQSTRYPDAIGGPIPSATFHERHAALAISLAREVLEVTGKILDAGQGEPAR